MNSIFHKKLFFVTLLLLSIPSFAQRTSITQLFYPNVTLTMEQIPSVRYNGTSEYGLSRSSVLGFIPLRTEIQAGIGIGTKFDIKAKHTLMLANLAQLTPILDGKEKPANGFKTASVGIIQLQASLRDKFWVYGGGIGLTESNETFFTPQPYLWGGAARMRIFGLQSQILYGTAIVYNQRFRIIPIFGFNKGLGNGWSVNGLLPFQATVNKKITDWFNVDGNIALGGYSGGFQEIMNNEKLARKQNYQHIKFTVAANAHVLGLFNLSVETGLLAFRQLRTFNSAAENITSYTPSVAPYLGLSVRYLTNKSKLSSKFMNKVGIGF
jgi:hypothetical protein